MSASAAARNMNTRDTGTLQLPWTGSNHRKGESSSED